MCTTVQQNVIIIVIIIMMMMMIVVVVKRFEVVISPHSCHGLNAHGLTPLHVFDTQYVER